MTASVDRKVLLLSFCLDFCKAFDTILHKIFVTKCRGVDLTDRLLDGWGIGWMSMSKELQSMAQCPRAKSSSVLEGSTLGPIQFIVFSNNMDSGIGWTLNKFADNNKLTGAVHRLEGRLAVHRNLEDQAHVNLTKDNPDHGKAAEAVIFKAPFQKKPFHSMTLCSKIPTQDLIF